MRTGAVAEMECRAKFMRKTQGIEDAQQRHKVMEAMRAAFGNATLTAEGYVSQFGHQLRTTTLSRQYGKCQVCCR